MGYYSSYELNLFNPTTMEELEEGRTNEIQEALKKNVHGARLARNAL